MNESQQKPSILFATGVGTVTGANFLLETPAGTKILIDCGMVQGERVAQEENREKFPYDPASIDALLITHAHLDHVGRIPKLVKEGYKGPIYSTSQTKQLAELVLADAAGILAEEARREGRDPLYLATDVPPVFLQWKTVEYHTQTEIAPDVSIYLKDAGHILGSTMIEVTLKDSQGTKILFTGDLGNSPAPLLRDTETVGDVDYMVMESCYGDRNHEDRETRSAELENIIKAALARGGTLVIPAFSIDRTQVLLYELNNMVEQGRIPSVPIFVDSPMGIKATDVYRDSIELFNPAAQAQIRNGDDIFDFPKLQYTMSQGESRSIEHLQGAKIILAGSGMSVGGRVISHEERFLPDATSTLLLVGYQSPGSLGRALADGTKKVHIHGQDITVRAHIETIYGYSAHKDGDHLVEFVATATDRLKQVYVAMGEPGASMHLAQRLNDELRVKAMMPERLKRYELK
ncbi:MAG: RNA-metabolising metallo-beta-lactamase [Candidatus Parcubacteria bacterium]|nr:RNA-metabolising metallo-beta-lactamase [Candidatus Parcubacteria bacterium]